MIHILHKSVYINNNAHVKRTLKANANSDGWEQGEATDRQVQTLNRRAEQGRSQARNTQTESTE